MNTLAIDIGTYSIKFFEVQKERKSLRLLHFTEVILDEVRETMEEDVATEEIQTEIIESYLDEMDAVHTEGFEGKIVFQVPNHLFTTRYLHIPVKQVKKAEQMLPFQLDDELPYTIPELHYVTKFTKVQEGLDATVYISNLQTFDQFYQNLDQLNIIPAMLTSEMSALQCLMSKSKIEENNYCLIDLGHESTKVYFFHQNRIVSNHVSTIGGKVVDENISNTYDIPMDEVSIFKHQNSFFLTENQFSDVDEDQQEFAKLMKIIFWPLVMDLKRWLLGYRVARGSNIQKIILTGGTSRITNIDNFFSQNLNLPVEILKFHDIPTLESMGLTLEQQCSYQMAQTLAFSTYAKPLPINFLSGEYASSFKDHIPLHSTVFIAVRVLLVSLFILVGVLLEWNLLVNEEASLDRIITSSLRKNKSLRLKKSQRRLFKKDPKSTHRLLLRKEKNIVREIKSLEVAFQIDAVSPLANLSQKVSKNKKVDLHSFSSKGGKASAFFKTSSTGKLKDLEALERILKNSDLKEKNVRLNKRKGQLNFDFKFN